ncbi:MAG TPA: DMT family transporter [Burkholderiales bacterium]|jgi:drug/metabolite transporter (DMT)-like permease|nr:DMT family transporter [Burkholderiales bacterium]
MHTITARQAPAINSLGLLFVVLWSSAWIAGKVGLPYAGPFTLLLIRFVVAAAVMLLIALATKAPWPDKVADYAHLAVAGVLIQGVALGCAYLGLELGVSAGMSGLVNGLAPLLTAFGAVPFLGERVGSRQWLGLGVGLMGVVLVVVDQASLGGAGWAGYAATFGALAAFVCGTLYQKKFCSTMDLRTGSFIQLAAASAAVFLPALRLDGLQVEWNWTLILASSWLSLANSIGAFSLLYVLLRSGKASRVSALFYLVPPVTAIMAFFAFHETLSPAALAGFAVAAGGVYLGTRQ